MPIQPEQYSHHDEPIRRLGFFSSVSIVVGSMLGIGIFLAPVMMAPHVNSVSIFLGVWVFTGLVALSGATAYAELGVLFPKSGGDYIFHKEALGNSTAFAYGWGLLSAGFAGSIAAMSVPLCTYQLGHLLGFDLSTVCYQFSGITLQWAQVFALILIIGLTLINVIGVWLSSFFQLITTYLPLLLLIALSVAVFNLTPPEAHATLPALPASAWTLHGLTEAFLQAYFAYSGWNAITYAAGEVKDPQKNIPFSIVGGTLLVMLLYLSLCSAALYSLQLGGLRQLYEQRGDIGTAMAQELASNGFLDKISLGISPVTLISTVIGIALIASINATILGGGRVALALAQHRCFWSGAAELSPRWGTPAKALWSQALIACLAVIFIPWQLIFSLVSLVMVVGGSLSVLSLYVLRVKRPEVPRPYRALGYPLFPALFISAGLLVLFVKISEAIYGNRDAQIELLGLFLVICIFIGHYIFTRSKASPSSIKTSG